MDYHGILPALVATQGEQVLSPHLGDAEVSSGRYGTVRLRNQLRKQILTAVKIQTGSGSWCAPMR
jgi:hypothetical protein